MRTEIVPVHAAGGAGAVQPCPTTLTSAACPAGHAVFATQEREIQ